MWQKPSEELLQEHFQETLFLKASAPTSATQPQRSRKVRAAAAGELDDLGGLKRQGGLMAVAAPAATAAPA